jgi:hypothetical protein
MGSSILPHKRKVRGEPSKAWTTLRETDIEEKWSLAREIPSHVREYERSRWRLVSDDPDERLVSAEDAAWQHLDDNSWEASYYDGRRGDDGEEGHNIDASLLNIDSRIPVLQPEDSRPSVEWHALGGASALASLLREGEERRDNFVTLLEDRARWVSLALAWAEDKTDTRAIAKYEAGLFKSRYADIQQKLMAEMKADPANDHEHRAELTEHGIRKLRIIAAVDAAERVRRYAARLRRDVASYTLQKQILRQGLQEARALTFVLNTTEYIKYAKLVTARLEWDRSYLRGADEAVRARFASAVCAGCGGSRLKIRRHPSYHWYSSCPDCEDTAPLRVSEVEAQDLPVSQYKTMYAIKRRVSVALRSAEKNPPGFPELNPTGKT